MTISAEVAERALREIHLVAFEAAVREAGVWAVMTAYNKVNGIYCGEQPDLINGILRGEWGFDGLVMSDWFGTHSTAPAALAGLDLEMPGPSAWLGPTLAAAVREGLVDESVVDGQVRHLLHLMGRVGLLDGTAPAGTGVQEREEDDPGRRAVAREAAADGTVMLVNDGLLPLSPETSLVAVLGPNASQLAMGGGSSEVTPHRRRSVAQALARTAPHAVVSSEVGCRIDRGLPALDLRLMDGEGLRVDYFDGAGPPSGDPVATGIGATRRALMWIGPPQPQLAGGLRARYGSAGRFTPDVSGRWRLGLESAGRAVLRVRRRRGGRQHRAQRAAPASTAPAASRSRRRSTSRRVSPMSSTSRCGHGRHRRRSWAPASGRRGPSPATSSSAPCPWPGPPTSPWSWWAPTGSGSPRGTTDRTCRCRGASVSSSRRCSTSTRGPWWS